MGRSTSALLAGSPRGQQTRHSIPDHLSVLQAFKSLQLYSRANFTGTPTSFTSPMLQLGCTSQAQNELYSGGWGGEALIPHGFHFHFYETTDGQFVCVIGERFTKGKHTAEIAT